MDMETEGAITGIKFLTMYSLLMWTVGLGAICNALVQFSRARNSDRRFDKVDIAIAVVISVFSGVIFGLTAAYFWPDQQLVLHGISGMGAFLGLNGLNKITDLMLDAASKHLAGRSNNEDSDE